MAKLERFRQPVSGPLDFDALQRRILEGWKLVAFEWEREVPAERATSPSHSHQTPFGCQLAEDASGLEDNRTEMEILFRMMDPAGGRGPVLLYRRRAESRRVPHPRRTQLEPGFGF